MNGGEFNMHQHVIKFILNIIDASAASTYGDQARGQQIPRISITLSLNVTELIVAIYKM